ncbi:PREDICTED: putative uncharacterized protein DDB_G0282133 [Papilio xuthus]|uniref:Uncharacterized protein n=1 Tax=Papilio xuthus TaxID=66420 RepID=A0AAJ7EDT2_PAPXU|nr:PREDICTED: putative uncharacterized protein DDB_G0282133 [Papilio xuthus]
MRYLLVIAAFTALAFAKPEFYKEKEDFQYSRSSSDEGSKSGFYGAQRGNMGGNYEKAHNMDGLAQHQMSGLVRTVEGELGDGYKMRTGSVYSAANSRGTYGSGHYDLSNLQGRNFGETESFDNSHSSMMAQSSAFRNSRLNGGAYSSSNRAHSSGYRGYQAGDQSQQYIQTDNLQSADHLQSAHGYDYGSEAAHLSTSGFQTHHDYDLSASNLDRTGAYGSNTRSRILTAAPVRVIVRPGIRRTVPLTAQVYDADHSDTSFNLEQSNINRDAEVLNTNSQQVSYRPSNAPKHYESSYSYHKEWEKHNTQPINAPGAEPTENPFPAQSEIRGDVNEEKNLENIQQHSNTYNTQASNTAFAANTQSSSQARYQAGYNRKHSSSSSLAENTNGYITGRRSASLTGGSLVASNANEYNAGSSSSLLASNANGYKAGSSSLLNVNTNGFNKASHATNSEESVASAADSGNLVQVLNSKPKSYHSSYSYHKSWERQGDPYVIKPAGSSTFDGQESQKLTAASASQGAYSSHHYGAQYKQAHHSFSQNGFDSDCDEEGHVRVARSSDSRYKPELQAYQNMYQGQEEYGQQTQSRLENLEDLGQQTQNQWDNLQNFGQQEQSNWENSQNLGQQIQSQWDNLQDLGQQPQHQWDNLQNLGQQTEEKFDKLEDLGQQPQSQWDNIVSQETEQKFDTLHTMGQQSQNQWDNMPEIGQMTQGKLDKLENFGQQTQTQWDKIESFDQKSQNKLHKVEDLGQQQQATWGSTEQQNRSWQKLEDLNQHTLSDLEQQIQDHDEQSPKMVFYGKEFDQQENVQSNDFNLNNTQDSQLIDNKHYSENKLSQKEDKQLVRGPWNNAMFHLGGFQQENSNFDLDNQNSKHTPNKNFDRPDEAQNSEMYEFGSPKIFDSQQTQNTWNLKEEDTIQQKPFNQQSQTGKSSHTTTEKNSHPLGGQWDKTDSESAELDKDFHSQDEQNSSLLGSLWDKIDGIAKETLKDTYDEDDSQKSNKVDSTDWSPQESKPSATHNTPKPSDSPLNINLLKPNIKPNQDKSPRPIDVGRGDIGPEDSDFISDTPKSNIPYKTPKEIDSLSLTRPLNKQSADSNDDKNKFNMLSDRELKIVQDLIKKIETEDSDEIVTTTSTTTSPIPTISTNIDENILADLNEKEEKFLQGISKHIISNENKKRTSTPFTPTRYIYKEQSRNKEQFEHSTHKNLISHHHDETNINKELDQKNEDYEPEEQQNMEQQFEDFQQTQDLQNANQLENFSQQHQSDWNSENNLAQVLDQQLIYLGEVSRKLNDNQINDEIKEIEATQKTKINELTPPEPELETEKHGFWKSVGSKLTNAKKKVMSWFS